MAEVGLLAPDARVELIEGEIIDMAPIEMEHGWVVDRLNHLLVTTVGAKGVVRVQGAVRLSQWSQPQPDVVILAPRSDYRTRHPTGADSLLVIEVSDTTVRYDLNVKTPLYARHGVPEVWIIDLSKPCRDYSSTCPPSSSPPDPLRRNQRAPGSAHIGC
jgi:Uma2 family endonuclease